MQQPAMQEPIFFVLTSLAAEAERLAANAKEATRRLRRPGHGAAVAQ